MVKIIPARKIHCCGECPFRADGGVVEDICIHIYPEKYIDYNSDEVDFPEWCPLETE